MLNYYRYIEGSNIECLEYGSKILVTLTLNSLSKCIVFRL